MKHAKSMAGLLLAVLFVFPSTTIAESPQPDETVTVWIDLDGDGFDDNAKDDNKDGIPDATQPANPTESVPDRTGIFANMQTPAPLSIEVDLPLSLQFEKRSKTTLAQCLTHFDLEASFGSGLGSGTSGAGGGACAGGICF